MTLDIERERREFETAHPGMNFKREYSRSHLYANTTVQGRWTTWLAAKRSMQGSAEPVSEEQITELDLPGMMYVDIVRKIEEAHGITKEKNDTYTAI